MLFSITVSYIRPLEDVKEHLDAHKEWLVRYIMAGTILAAGPLRQGDGGFVLAHAQDVSEIMGMIAEDPFDRHKVASFDIQACDPALRAAGFPEQWAPAAKAFAAAPQGLS
ncbi:YciI family protein (plasmid) [Azospirillum sp. A29]|uniref:YciI family protein n=1 Tax=Azospirillum sp. A29 TaxID=3160606 RepID=UPI003670A92A